MQKLNNTLIIVRHGMSCSNGDPNFYNMPDSANPLNSLGVKQAIDFGCRLNNFFEKKFVNTDDKYLFAFSSTYTRAKMTGRIALDVAGLNHFKIEETAQLGEVNRNSVTWNPSDNKCYFNDLETSEDVKSRFLMWVDKEKWRLGMGNIIAFSHGKFMKLAYEAVTDSVWDGSMKNTKALVFTRKHDNTLELNEELMGEIGEPLSKTDAKKVFEKWNF